MRTSGSRGRNTASSKASIVASQKCSQELERQLLMTCEDECGKTSNDASLQKELSMILAKKYRTNVSILVQTVQQKQEVIRGEFYGQNQYDLYLEIKAGNKKIRIWFKDAPYNGHEDSSWRPQRIFQQESGNICIPQTWTNIS